MRAELGMESFLVPPEGAGGVGGFAGMKSEGSAQTVALNVSKRVIQVSRGGGDAYNDSHI